MAALSMLIRRRVGSKVLLALAACGLLQLGAAADGLSAIAEQAQAMSKLHAENFKKGIQQILDASKEFEVAEQAASGDDAKDVAAAAAEDPLKTGLVDEWDKHMEGFVPELLLTFPLAARSDEFFYEDIPADSPPVLIRGGFFASASEETSSVEFSITDPKGNIVYEKTDQAEGLFHFIAKKSGTYTFIVSNHKWMQEKMVTFTVGKGNQTHLQPEHLTSMEDHVKAVEKTLVDIQTESTYLWIRQKSHMKAVEGIHTRVLAFCVVEFLILVGVSGFQVYYIKGLLSDRRIL
ncbi:unnamed protein product [Polarella glacialis]|uniref:GOLD domain-containing protein n=1 Tax=Polarella glacialis TaxID=89957 RepID=A0A813FB98_POLGL|nr:unnamed protein product [Polarella glacialis]